MISSHVEIKDRAETNFLRWSNQDKKAPLAYHKIAANDVIQYLISARDGFSSNKRVDVDKL